MADTRPLPTNDGVTITRYLLFGRADGWAAHPVRHNVHVRKLLVGLIAGVATLAVAAVGADFGGAIFAEYRWARTVRAANGLSFDPWVGILGFPFVLQAADRRFNEVEIRASGVEHPVVGKASLEATMHAVDVADTSWLITPDAKLPIGELESRIIVDSTHVGRFMGIKDLLVEAPQVDTNDPTGGTTESGISSGTGVVFTGTPTGSGFGARVSVSVDLSIVGDAKTTLRVTATGVLTGPGTADQDVPAERKAAVLNAFSATIPGLTLPFALTPTTAGARGSDVIIEGITTGVTVPITAFRRP